MIHEIVNIWGKGEYRGDVDDGFVPTMNSYVLDGSRKRGAVLICPGGGYSFISKREAEPVALAFNAAGYNAFVLDYSVAPRRHPLPLLDVSRAICLDIMWWREVAFCPEHQAFGFRRPGEFVGVVRIEEFRLPVEGAGQDSPFEAGH